VDRNRCGTRKLFAVILNTFAKTSKYDIERSDGEAKPFHSYLIFHVGLLPLDHAAGEDEMQDN